MRNKSEEIHAYGKIKTRIQKFFNINFQAK